MKSVLVVDYPKTISRYFVDVLKDYTFQPDKYIWNPDHFEFDPDRLREDGIELYEKYRPELFIKHQFYRIMQRDDLRKMVEQLENSPDDVIGVGLYPRHSIGGTSYFRENPNGYGDHDIRYTEGTNVVKADKTYEVLKDAMSSNKDKFGTKCHIEVRWLHSLKKLGYRFETAPYVREEKIIKTEYLSKSNKTYEELP